MIEEFFDVETTTKNKGHPFDPDNYLVSYVTLSRNSEPQFAYYRDPGFRDGLVATLSNATVLVGFNVKFDLHWAINTGFELDDHAIWDCMLAEYVISGQQLGFVSLNETLRSYGFDPKPDQVAAYWEAGVDTPDIPVDILETYNKYDVTSLKDLKAAQMQNMTQQQIALVYLMGDDMKTLLAAEQAGVKFDVVKATANIEKLDLEINEIEHRLNAYLPSMRSVCLFNWDSGDHLSALIYGGAISFDYSVAEESVYKSGPRKGETYTKNRWFVERILFPKRFDPLERTTLKKCLSPGYDGEMFYQTDAPTLAGLRSKEKNGLLLLNLLQSRSEKIKVAEMVKSIIKRMEDMNWQDNYIHGAFNQNAVITGRLSSSGPNLQNTPPEVDELLVSRYDN